MTPAWRRYVRPQDFVWIFFFVALAVFVPLDLDPEDITVVRTVLVALGVVQILEPRIGATASIYLELVLCYVLIGSSHGISSSFWVVLCMPVISAATNFGLWGASLSTVAACGVYLCFLLYLERFDQVLPPEEIPEVVLRVLWFPVVAFLTYQLADASREKARKLQAVAEDLAEAKEQVGRADRLAALGQLTAGLAHELRNPLSTMKTSAEMLQRSVGGENEVAKEMAQYIAQEVDRTNSLITRFLDFARPRHLKLEKGDVHAMLDRAIVRFDKEKSGAAQTISVFKNYSPDIPPIKLDTELMEHVITNLLNNAAQASPANSVVTVKTKMADDRRVEISVIDRGSGIDPKNLESIFNPFFTTKSEGTGLGLPIVSKIVDEHGGQITVESTLGEGSVFRVHLPVGE